MRDSNETGIIVTMNRIRRWAQASKESLVFAGQALTTWNARQILAAAGATILVGLVIGIATVLIPNSIFSRDIPPVWWNYPVWIITSAMTGVLIATYVRPSGHSTKAAASRTQPTQATDVDAAADGPVQASGDQEERRTSRFALAGSMLAWFAVGCPVCNKIALLALGYSGALTWFAPVQPFLAMGALVLSAVAMVWRLRGQVACPVPAQPAQRDLATA